VFNLDQILSPYQPRQSPDEPTPSDGDDEQPDPEPPTPSPEPTPSPASQAPADHPPAAGVNPDASLFYRAPGIDLVERGGGVAPMDHFGNAVRHTEANSAGLAGSSLRHNKSGRDRSSRRSQPAADSPRRGTAAPTLPRHGTPTRVVDERHDCQGIGPAYLPGTVRGTASSQTAKFRSRRRACLLIPTSRRRVSPQWCSSAHAWRPTRRPSRHQFQTPLRTYRTSRGRPHRRPSRVARRLDAGRASYRHLPGLLLF
jgi:hypothetical protein